MLKLTWANAAAWRIHRHHLDQRAPAESLLAVASRLCGLHAQLMSSAELAAWARVEDFDRQAVARALWEDRTLVKTWAMRGTLHLLPAGELPLWHAALGTSGRFLKPAQWLRAYGITIAELDELTQAVGTALDGRVMTREELAQEVGRLTGSPGFAGKVGENSWGTLLRPAAFAGSLCFGPSLGRLVRFTHPRTWLSGQSASAPVETKTATASVARRFLAAYGPATCQDLARWWNGGGVSTARQWIASLGDEVVTVDLEGAPAWMLAAHVPEMRELPRPRSVRLLPGFDPYVVAASFHAERLLPGDFRSRVYRPQGWISPVLLVNGRMEGTWRTKSRAAASKLRSSRWSRRRYGCAARPGRRPSGWRHSWVAA
jgi:hypothetical protein